MDIDDCLNLLVSLSTKDNTWLKYYYYHSSPQFPWRVRITYEKRPGRVGGGYFEPLL